MKQWEYMLGKFKRNNGVLTTMDMISDLHTAAEYRRTLCDLKEKGYVILTSKISQKSWRYQLLQTEPSGQQVFA